MATLSKDSLKKSLPQKNPDGKGRVSFYTLGCKVNQYETQILREKFNEAGYITVDEDAPADIYIVNTCSVTNLADRKSRQHIRQFRRHNPDAVIVAMGCYAQLKPDEVTEIPGVCIVAGTNEKSHIVEYVEDYIENNRKGSVEKHIVDYDKIDEYEDLGCISAMKSRTRAFIKVQEGCDRFCSYCIIPYARGKARSRAPENIVREVTNLLNNGFKEIVLTGINTALYGIDWKASKGRSRIVELVKLISDIPGDFRIRLSSLEPNVIDLEIAEQLIKIEKLCPHMHLSIQSGSDGVLHRMGRRYNVDSYKKIVEVLRSSNPLYAITTDIIVGFPQENEEEFQESLRSIEDIKFSKIHVFKYSLRTGTKAAEMSGQCSDSVKNLRSSTLSEASESIASEFLKLNQGTVHRVLFERYDKVAGTLEGYTDNYIKVICKTGASENSVGAFADVKLVSADDGFMIGEII